jgi:hypothetical protein
LEVVTDTELEQKEIPLNKRLLFFASVQNLLRGKFANKKHIRECPVCKPMTPEEQKAFWNEWKLAFSDELEITPQMLVGFDKCHLRFAAPMGEHRTRMWKIINEIKELH